MRKYPKYKASGLDGIDEVPEPWEIIKLKYIAKIHNGQDQKEVLDENGEYPIYGSGGIFGYANQYLFEGPSVLLGRKGTVDKPRLVLNPFWSVDTAYYTKISKKVNPVLFFHLCNQINFDYFIYGSAIPSMTARDLNEIKFALPSLPEQYSIVRFLDYKTGQIDRFIANRQKQIELLKEQKAGIINKAVTKGINPNAKMKPSGIEWIGEIPDHWIVIKLKYIIKTMASGVSVNSTDEPAEAHEYGVLKTSCVYTGEFNPNENKKIVENEYHRIACPVKANTIIISRMNTPELVGANGFVDKDYVGLFLPDRLWQTVFFKKAKIVPKWLSYFLSSNRFRTLLSSLATGTSASMKNITHEDVLGSFICLPPIEEQDTMVSYFEEETSIINTLISKYQKQIDLMQEYRTSLISQAVTGKIDVREWQPKARKYQTEELPVAIAAEN